MPSNYYTRRVLILGIIISGFSCSCKKFVQIPNAKNQISNSVVFADSADATSSVLGIYINMMSISTQFNLVHGGVSAYTALSSDELIPSNNTGDDRLFYLNALSQTKGSSGTLWTSAYTWIYQANACIEGISPSTGISLSCKNQLIGESKFIRALLYFNLVNLFGDVPLIITTDYKANAIMPKTPAQEVYQQIINDLTDAQSLLTAGYVSAGRVRPDKFAATALLARVYLYQKEWVNAETAASQVISSGNYSLVSDLKSVFLANSSESILQFIPLQAGTETAEGTIFIPNSPSVIPRYYLSNFLLTAFEANDQRKINWLGKNTVVLSGIPTDFYYPFKYQHRQDGLATPKDYYMILRLGEQYLIRAEARAQQGHIPDAVADLNLIRNRAGLLNTTAATQTDLIAAIYHERQTELFVESGNRWYDLKRTDRADQVMSVVTPVKGGSWNPNWELYPIFFQEIQANPFLVQNPGYN